MWLRFLQGGLIFWRRWAYEKIDKVYVDIGVNIAVR